MLVLALPGLAHAAETIAPSESALISNGVVTLGVRSDGGLAGIGLGKDFQANADGSSLSWGLNSPNAAPTTAAGSPVVESFSNDGFTAVSAVGIEDAALGGPLRVHHNFHLSDCRTQFV